MREMQTEQITQVIREMCIEVNYRLAPDMKRVFCQAVDQEESPLGRQVLKQLEEDLRIADKDMMPIYQDTETAAVLLKAGQEVHSIGGSPTNAVNEGVRRGYEEEYLRKSVVGDPIGRINTRDNTPAVIHYEIVEGDQVDLIVAPKGFGSGNMSRVFTLKPADGLEGVKNAILTAVRDAGPNARSSMVIGVGIGGIFEKCTEMARHAPTRNISEKPKTVWARELEEEMLRTVNKLGIRLGGLGGRIIALTVNVETYPTYIAGLPVAVNICCHVNRHVHRVL